MRLVDLGQSFAWGTVDWVHYLFIVWFKLTCWPLSREVDLEARTIRKRSHNFEAHGNKGTHTNDATWYQHSDLADGIFKIEPKYRAMLLVEENGSNATSHADYLLDMLKLAGDSHDVLRDLCKRYSIFISDNLELGLHEDFTVYACITKGMCNNTLFPSCDFVGYFDWPIASLFQPGELSFMVWLDSPGITHCGILWERST